jgi:hypothetical protein
MNDDLALGRPRSVPPISCRTPTRSRLLRRIHPDVAFRFMWQLVEDERRLHNQTAILGRGNAAERISTMLVDINEKRTTRRYRGG